MRPNICLIRCFCITLPYPPDTGLGYLKASLKKAGFEVQVWDINREVFLSEDEPTKETWRWPDVTELKGLGEGLFERHKHWIMRKIDSLVSEGTNVFGFSVWQTNRNASMGLARIIKARHPQAKIILGGPEVFPHWSGEILSREPCVDAIVYGEGEESMVELMESLRRTGRLDPRPGCYVRSGGGMVRLGERQPLDVGRLPYPDYDDYNFQEDEKINIAFNRGCVRKCQFCSVPGVIPQFRWRSAEDIYAELKHQKDRYGIRRFWETSPTLNSNLRELLKLCDMIIEGGLDIDWNGYALFQHHLSADILSKMRRAGCTSLNFGMESGSDRVLSLMKKSITVRIAERNLRDLKEAGINTCLNFVIGFPGETEDDFQETLKFIFQNAAFIKEIGSMSTLWISPYEPVYQERERFEIELGKPDPETNYYHHWRTKDGTNTPQIREDRLGRFRKLMTALGLGSSTRKDIVPAKNLGAA